MARTTFTNERRQVSVVTEGFGEYATRWPSFEILCPCGNWTSNYGDASRQVGDNPDEQEWLCPACVAESDAEWEKQQADEAMLV